MVDGPTLRFSEAEEVGEELRQCWPGITREKPPEDLRLADVVQFVLGRARDRMAQREA